MENLLKLLKSWCIQLFRDGMLFLLIIAPFLMGIILQNALPIINKVLMGKNGFSIVFIYPISDGLLITLTPILIGMICAFVILDERDEGISNYFKITPSNGRTYLVSRIVLPMVWGLISSIFVVVNFALTLSSIISIIAISLVGTLQGIIFAMVIVSIANNKVEGLALSKIVNIFTMFFIAPFFIDSKIKYISSIFPSFWIGETINNIIVTGNMSIINILLGMVISLVWITLLTRVFLKRIY